MAKKFYFSKPRIIARKTRSTLNTSSLPIEFINKMNSIYEGALQVIKEGKRTGTFFEAHLPRDHARRARFRLNRKLVKERTDKLERRLREIRGDMDKVIQKPSLVSAVLRLVQKPSLSNKPKLSKPHINKPSLRGLR